MSSLPRRHKGLYPGASCRSHEVIVMTKGRPPTCIFCGGTESVGKGVRRTKTLGLRRIRLCKACGRKFTPRNQKLVVDGQEEATEKVPVAPAPAGEAADPPEVI